MEVNTKRTIKLLLKIGFNQLVLSAGMHRSASTLLYNILRLCLHEKFGGSLTAGWIGDVDRLTKNRMNLIKIHTFHPISAIRAKYIFYTYRDIRQALVSANLKLNLPLSINTCRYMINQYQLSKKYADLMLSYEDIVNDTEQQIIRIANIIKVDVDPQSIIKNLPSIMSERSRSKGYDRITQMHGGHSSGAHQDEWKTVLTNQLKEQIGEEFDWWFKETGYK